MYPKYKTSSHFLLENVFFLTKHSTAISDILVLEVIYPQVPLRIPCYDLAPLTKSWFESPNKRLPHQNPVWVT